VNRPKLPGRVINGAEEIMENPCELLIQTVGFVPQLCRFVARPPADRRAFDQRFDLLPFVSTHDNRELSVSKHSLELHRSQAGAPGKHKLGEKCVDLLRAVTAKCTIECHLTDVFHHDLSHRPPKSGRAS
jgi:hypothetical protein